VVCDVWCVVLTSDTAAALVGQPYIPDFTKAFQHFCIHAGGRAVVDALEQNLQLDTKHLVASRAVLSRYVCFLCCLIDI